VVTIGKIRWSRYAKLGGHATQKYAIIKGRQGISKLSYAKSG
jgi:hypothetical protein